MFNDKQLDILIQKSFIVDLFKSHEFGKRIKTVNKLADII